MTHNPNLNRGKLLIETNSELPYMCAWGLCILYAKHSRENLAEFKSARWTNLGDPNTSFETFSGIMQKLAEKDLWCSYGKVRLSFSDKARNEEKQRLMFAAKALRKQNKFCVNAAFR